MTDWKWEKIAEHENLTEGPVWDGTALLYSECAASLTWRFDPQSGSNSVWRRDTEGANGQCFSRDGKLFNCEGMGHQVTRVENGERVEVIANAYEGMHLNAPNDLAIDDAGNVWFTDPNYGERPRQLDHESLYRASPANGNWTLTRVASDTHRPNGILFSLDEKTLYVAESPNDATQRRQLRAYPVRDDGSLGDHRVFHDFGPGRGIDGMTLTDDDLIVATAGSSRGGPGPMVYVFAPNGRVISTHPTPADMPTNCAFAESGRDILYVTFGSGYVYRVPNTGLRGHLMYP